MYWALLILVSVVAFALFGPVFPSNGPPPRWRLALARRLERLAGRMRRRSEPPPDPFEALRVQTRLSAIANEMLELESSCCHVFAKAHRLQATRAAYDALLAEACHLAGVEVATSGRHTEQERLREEVELAARGWSW